MFTAISAAVAAFLARKGIVAAIAVMRWLLPLVPALALALACLIGYYREATFDRAVLAVAVVNEAVVAAQIAGLLAPLFATSKS